jgi:hypothetical protein
VEVRPLVWPDEIPIWARMHFEVNPDRPVTADGLETAYGSLPERAVFLALDGETPAGYGWIVRRLGSPVPEARVLVLVSSISPTATRRRSSRPRAWRS